MTKFILGTANFGNRYGVANNGDLLSREKIKSIVNWAQVNGINRFDTATAYGEAESILNTSLDYSLSPAVDTKLNKKSCQSSESIIHTANKIREQLGLKQLSVLYLHDEDLLQSSLSTEVTKGMLEVLNLGIAEKIGVSVYSKKSVFRCKAALPELTVFQVPENICDRRIASSDQIQQLSENGNSFVVRSIFLQGLLLMQPEQIPTGLMSATRVIQELNDYARLHSLSVMELCVAYAKRLTWASGIVIGVASLDQLMEIQKCSSILPCDWSTAISTLPLDIVDPRRWSL